MLILPMRTRFGSIRRRRRRLLRPPPPSPTNIYRCIHIACTMHISASTSAMPYRPSLPHRRRQRQPMLMMINPVCVSVRSSKDHSQLKIIVQSKGILRNCVSHSVCPRSRRTAVSERNDFACICGRVRRQPSPSAIAANISSQIRSISINLPAQAGELVSDFLGPRPPVQPIAFRTSHNGDRGWAAKQNNIYFIIRELRAPDVVHL